LAGNRVLGFVALGTLQNTECQAVPAIVLTLEVLGAVLAMLAAVEGYRATQIQPEPAWDRDPSLKPRNMAEDAWGMVHALWSANFWSGRRARNAGLPALASAACILIAQASKMLI
jgi:hypothetical protein